MMLTAGSRRDTGKIWGFMFMDGAEGGRPLRAYHYPPWKAFSDLSEEGILKDGTLAAIDVRLDFIKVVRDIIEEDRFEQADKWYWDSVRWEQEREEHARDL